MFERFTDRGRRIVVLAQEEARRLRHSYIGPEHLLLALLQTDAVATQVLDSLGVDRPGVRRAVEQSLGTGTTPAPEGHIPFAKGAKKVLEFSLREALSLGHNYIGTEHILLGVLREAESDSGAAAAALKLDIGEVRTRIVELLPTVSGPGGGPGGQPMQWTPALTEALARARQLAAGGPTSTGQVVAGIVGDPASQGAQVLAALGVTAAAVGEQLAAIPVTATSDAPPAPRAVEVRIGDQSTIIEDPEVAAALGGLTPEELKAALLQHFGQRRSEAS